MPDNDYRGAVPLFTIPGFGTVEFLDAQHLDGWKQIASARETRRELTLNEFTDEQLEADRRRRAPDWREAVREASPEHRELVVIDAAGDVVAAIVLAGYACENRDDRYGVAVEVAVAPSKQGEGLGTELMCELPRWLARDVPGAHAFADVCVNNTASEKMLRKAGWHKIGTSECNVWDEGRHECPGTANRYCSHSSHRTGGPVA